MPRCKVVVAGYGEIADRLDDPHRPRTRRWTKSVADLDMIDGAGAQRAAILAAAEAYVDAHRDDPSTVRRVMALVWGVGWLGYLAHIRTASDGPLEDIVSQADTPWWK